MRRNPLFLSLLSGILALLAAVCFCTPVWAAAEQPGYVRTIFNKDNGLPTDEANAVLQTEDGYLWIGSYGGLLRYDGTTFRNFSTEGAISTPSIRTLFQDSAGRLWIGSSDAGVFVYEDNVFTPVPCLREHGFLSIRDFAESEDGVIYVASTSGVAEVRDGTLLPLDDPQVTGETIYSLGIDGYGRLWCAMNTGRCAVLQDGRVTAMLDAGLFFPDGSKITCLASDSAHRIYLGTDGSALARVDCTGEALDGSDFSVRLYDATDAAVHNRICVTDSGDMLISGQQGFAWMMADGTQVDPHTTGRTDSVNCAALDYEGSVWLASSSEGLVRYAPGCFATPNAEAGLTGTAINAVMEAGGTYYAAVNEGLLAFDGDWHPTENALTRMLSGIPVQHLMADSRGRLWCSTSSDLGLVCYDPADGAILCFNPHSGLDSTRVRVSYEMADGTVAVGTQDGLALIRDDRVAAFYDKDDGIETQSILCLVQAPNGTLLMGSAGGGIYALQQDGTVTNYSYDAGLEDGVVLRIVPDEDGATAFVSAGSHLYYWSDGTFRRLDDLEIGVGSIFDLRLRDGTLWLMQDSGLYAVDKALLLAGERPHATRYGTGDGLTGSMRVNTWNYLSPDGRLYLATRSGISIFDFPTLSFHTPLPVITSVRVDGQTYEQPEQLTIASDARRITVNFAALTFSGNADVCMAYQLVGFARNETVLESTVSGSISYTNLAGGTYEFHLRVFDPADPETQETVQLTIVKEKKLSEYPLTWIIGVVLLGVAALAAAQLFVRAKLKYLNRQQQMYRSIVGQALRTFANTLDAKDPYTNGHSLRVAQYARELTRRMGYADNDQETVYYVALLHDIGKIAIPDSILNKTGPLTPEERAIIQTHPVKGGEILRDFTALKGIADGARYHHERYDGKGYCAGLAGEDIPLMARIICVADSYDAMSSDRCYRKALPPETIIEELQKGSGTQFDPRIAAIMVEMIREGVVPVQLPPPAGDQPQTGDGGTR